MQVYNNSKYASLSWNSTLQSDKLLFLNNMKVITFMHRRRLSPVYSLLHTDNIQTLMHYIYKNMQVILSLNVFRTYKKTFYYQ